MIMLFPSRTVKLIDVPGQQYDKRVNEWKSEVENVLLASDVDSEVSVSLSNFHLSEINSSDPLEEASCRSVSPTLSEQLEVVMVTPTVSEPAVFTQASPKSPHSKDYCIM